MSQTIENGYLIIPARNEEENLLVLFSGILECLNLEKQKIILVDNGSTDNTFQIAKNFGVTVLKESALGYGNACLKAIRFIEELVIKPEWIIITNADYSDDPIDLKKIIESLNDTKSDIVIGSRLLQEIEKGSMSLLQIFGNRLTCFLIHIFFRRKFTDLGSLRIIRYSALAKMKLKDTTWGWNIEMQIRAIQEDLKIIEVPVNYRKRKFGESKISGNLFMAMKVGIKIFFIFFKLLILEKKSNK